MTCPRCSSLEARVASLQDELRAWKEYRDDTPADGVDPDLLAAANRLLGLSRSEGRLLLVLIANAGKIVSRDKALGFITENDPLDYDSNLMHVYVCRVRGALRRIGLDRAIESIRLQGVSMPRDVAARVTAVLGQYKQSTERPTGSYPVDSSNAAKQEYTPFKNSEARSA